MLRRILVSVFACALFLFFGVAGLAQESEVAGSLKGVVVDSTGAVVPGAKVTLTGPEGTVVTTTDNEGNYSFVRLNPGTYRMKVEQKGFKAAEVTGAQVNVGGTSRVRVQLQPGEVSETVEVTANAVTVDTTSTATGSNLSDTFYSSVPVPRNVSGLFYATPGVADSGGAGRANPSIGGNSGLENMYIADGVNITDSAFGGLGIFTRQYGSVGTGINLSFVKEVNVKTGGFEPQYGQATGGIVQIVTKSGSDAYHGALGFFAAPRWGSATPKNVDDFRNRKFGTDQFVANANPVGSGTTPGYYAGPGAYDINGEIGGYVPRMKEHLFFFGSYNPTLLTGYVTPPAIPGSLRFLQANGFTGTSVPVVGLFTETGGRPIYTRIFANNYAGKLTYKINNNNSLETSLFGDPTTTNETAFRTVVAQNTSVFSSQRYQTRNWVVRYNTTISPTWLANANFTWLYNKFGENPLNPLTFNVVDRTTVGLTPTLSGLGFVENHKTNDFAYELDTSKTVNWHGQHTFMLGFASGLLNYNDLKSRTGGRFAVPDVGPTRNLAVYGCASPNGLDTCPLGSFTNAQFTLNARPTCTLCPIYRTPAGQLVPVAAQISRGEYGPALVATEGTSYAAYLNDTWIVNKHLTFSVGVRWEQFRMAGEALNYTFAHNWAPRLGVIYDPWGDRKTKIFFNYAQYNYQMPLDAAIRSLSSELDLTNLRFAPVIGPDNSVTVIPDAAHLLNGLPNGSGTNAIISAQAGGNLEGVAPGTQMQNEWEYVGGIERELGKGLVISARYVDRRLHRIVEDMSGVSPEAADFGAPFNQIFLIGNPKPGLDLFTNVPTPAVQPFGAACGTGIVSAFDGNGFPFSTGQQACFPGFKGANGLTGGVPVPDGISDGFAQPVRTYQAAEFELNKGFTNGWLMRFNYRLAYLRGNYEGAFRNDNGQTDPSISSLFDFTEGVMNLLGDQFAIGSLNTERRQIANLFGSYTFQTGRFTGLTLGTGISAFTGTPISVLANHPVYGNQGEVPIGGRGSQGRVPLSGGVNLHAEYVHKLTERTSIHLLADTFNVTNSMGPVTLRDQNRDLSFQPAFSNPDLLTPLNFQNPFYARFGVKFQF
jgi:hypothetical protein